MGRLYSHRLRANQPRAATVIDKTTWISLREFIVLRMKAHGFMKSFPVTCVDCRQPKNTSNEVMNRVAKIEIPDLDFWQDVVNGDDILPETTTLFDLIEFCYHNITHTQVLDSNPSFCRHREVRFYQEKGRNHFREGVNMILDRDRIGYYLTNEGQIERFGAPVLSDAIREATFNTCDEALDEMLETASGKFLSRDPGMRKDGLKALWDAWERLKTVEKPDSDKKASISALLDRAASGDVPFRDRLETETRELTQIGNNFMIRHSETDRHPLTDDRHVDYLFHRMFSLVYLLLDATGRVGASK